MPTIYSSASATARSVASISCDVPTNDASHRLVAFVSAAFASASPGAAFTFTGWTSITTASEDPLVYTQAFYHAGALTGPATITVNKTADDFKVAIFAVSDMSSTVDGISTGLISNGLLQTISSITTTKANDLLLACWAVGFPQGTADVTVLQTAMMDVLSVGASPAGGVLSVGLLVGDQVQAVAGASGTKTARAYNTFGSGITETGAHIMLALAPYEGPTIPTLTFPNGGEALTVGAIVNVTWTQSTSPTAAQSTLKYNLDYSVNNGVTWNNLVTLTGTGVGTYAWTVPSTLTTGGLVRIRSNDPAAALFSLGYDQSDAAFSIVAEAATLGAPVITAPAVGSVNNKGANVTVAWTHQGGAGNPQVAFTLQWANNSAFTSPTTVGPTTTATQSTSVDFSGQASGTTIYVKVKTQGVSVYSAYSNIVSFIVASLPSTPNITAPINASPPTTPLPTVTFTEADAFVARKMRVTVGGVEAYNSGEIVSTVLSFTSGYTFANGVVVVMYLSVKNSYGLWSVEDSETLTPSYAGPATPTLTITPVPTGGYVLATIANSDTPTYNELWRYDVSMAASTAIKVGALLPKNASFADYNVTSSVAVEYKYFARAYNSTLYTDSAVSSTTDLTLMNGFLHSVSRTGTASNATGAALSLLNTAGQWSRDESAVEIKMIGRAAPVVILGQAQWQRVTVTAAFTIYSQINDLIALWRTQKTGSVLCYRNQKGNRIFGKMSQPQIQDESSYLLATFEMTESYYAEGL